MKATLRGTHAAVVAALTACVSVVPAAYAADAMRDPMHNAMKKHKGDAMRGTMHKDAMRKGGEPAQ